MPTAAGDRRAVKPHNNEELLRRMIVQGQLGVGQPVNADMIRNLTGCSKAVAADIERVLVAEEFISSEDHRSTVRDWPSSSLAQRLNVMAALEAEIVYELAMPHGRRVLSNLVKAAVNLNSSLKADDPYVRMQGDLDFSRALIGMANPAASLSYRMIAAPAVFYHAIDFYRSPEVALTPIDVHLMIEAILSHQAVRARDCGALYRRMMARYFNAQQRKSQSRRRPASMPKNAARAVSHEQ